jgi:hypothetical protein
MLLLSDVAFGVGIVGAVVTVFLFTQAHGTQQAVSSLGVDLQPTSTGGTVSLRTAF